MTAFTGKRRWPLVALAIMMAACVAWGQSGKTDKRKSASTRPVSAAATRPAKTTAPTRTTAPASTSRPVASKISLTTRAAAKEAGPRIAHIRLAGEVLDSPPSISLFGEETGYTLRDWLQRLAAARNDERVQAVALEIDSPEMTWAQAQELADAVARLDKEKPVYTFMTSGGATEYIIASATSREVAMDPGGDLMITGLAAELMFFRGTLDWAGIKPQMIQIGKFKGAAEPLSEAGPSKEFKEIYESVFDDLYEQLCGQIARQRGLRIEEVKKIVDSGPFSAASAKKARLLDELVPSIDWEEHVASKVTPDEEYVWLDDYGKKSRPGLDLSNPFSLLGMLLKGPPREEIKDPTIAIIHADGVIVPGHGGEGLLGQAYVGAKTLVDCFNEVADDHRVKAVIFRINSPGGSALASELIYQAVEACAREKPVIVSISDVGASGGYYIASPATQILIDGAGITGSIGVISGKLALTGLLEKLQIHTYEIRRGENAGLFDSGEWSPKQEATMRKLAEETYDQFVSRVAKGRAGKVKDLEGVTQGRIFTGRQAVANGLADGLGGMREAVVAAQKAAKITGTNSFINLPRPRTLMDILSGEDQTTSLPVHPLELTLIRELAGKSPGLVYLVNLAQRLGRENILTAVPYYFSIRR